MIAVLLIAANLRVTITGVGPLLPQIAENLGSTEAALGALASVPLIAFAVVSPVAHGISARFGMSRVVLWSLVVLALGTVWRSIPGSTVNLWAGTALIGASIAIANVLMPAVVKRDFGSRIPLVMAAFTALLSSVGALASGVVVPISHIQVGGSAAGWSIALLATGVLVPFAIVAWMLAMRGRRDAKGSSVHGAGAGIWADPIAWLVLLYMGFQATTFFMLSTWLATIAQSHGISEITAGIYVMVFQLCSTAGSFFVPVLLRGRIERSAPALIPVISIVGAVGLIAAPSGYLFWVILCGLSSGAAMGTSLSLMSMRARTHEGASALSGMAQSGGYVIAAIGPIAFGALVAFTGGWFWPLLLVVAAGVAQLIVGVFVGRDRYVLDR